MKKYLRFALALMFAVMLTIPFAVPVAAAGEIRFERNSGTVTGFADLWNGWHKAQTFTPQVSHTITYVKLLLYREVIPAEYPDFYVRISGTDAAGNPLTPALCEGTFDGSTLTTSSTAPQWATITLGAGTYLTAGTKYAIVVRNPNSHQDEAVWWAYGSNTYTGGNAVHKLQDPDPWVADTDRDFMFEEWGMVSGTTDIGVGSTFSVPVTLTSPCDLQIYWDESPGAPGDDNITVLVNGIAVTGSNSYSFTVVVSLTPGSYTVGFRCDSSGAGDVAPIAYTITALDFTGEHFVAVLDTISPGLGVVLTPNLLFPVNRQMVEVNARVFVADNWDPDPVVSLVSVTSNQPENGPGDGNTSPDITIVDDDSFLLRAEFTGKTGNRVYTVTYSATDWNDNTTLTSATVIVPRNPKRFPVLVSPAEGAVLDNGRADHLDHVIWDFDWKDVAGATSYNIVVIRAVATVPVINATVTGSSYHYNGSGYIANPNLTGWTWMVRAKVAGQWSDWSEVRVFSVEPLDTDPPAT